MSAVLCAVFTFFFRLCTEPFVEKCENVCHKIAVYKLNLGYFPSEILVFIFFVQTEQGNRVGVKNDVCGRDMGSFRPYSLQCLGSRSWRG